MYTPYNTNPMRIHKKETIKELKRLRGLGLSISDLVRRFSIPKTTIWHHVHTVQVSSERKAAIKKRQGGASLRSKKDWERAIEEAREFISVVDLQAFLPLVLSILYWCEGRKKDSFEFINTDQRMIRLFLHILRKSFKITDTHIVPILRINSSMNKQKCLDYWAGVSGLPPDLFQVDINDKNNKTKSEYGLCRIRVKRGGYLLKVIHSMVAQLSVNVLHLPS